MPTCEPLWKEKSFSVPTFALQKKRDGERLRDDDEGGWRGKEIDIKGEKKELRKVDLDPGDIQRERQQRRKIKGEENSNLGPGSRQGDFISATIAGLRDSRSGRRSSILSKKGEET